MKKKKQILLDLKALRFDYHARLVLAEGKRKNRKSVRCWHCLMS